MTIGFSQTFPLDPNIKTAGDRIKSSPARMGAVILNTRYNGFEFANWLYVGTTGNVNLMQWDGTTIILNNMLGGIWHPVASTMILSSGTTATDLVWGS
jgi:hypothetical protein